MKCVMWDWKKRYYEIVRECATSAFRNLCQTGGLCELYLWYKPAASGQWGDLVAANDPGPEWSLVRPERISAAMTLDNLIHWICESTKQTPIIGS